MLLFVWRNAAKEYFKASLALFITWTIIDKCKVKVNFIGPIINIKLRWTQYKQQEDTKIL